MGPCPPISTLKIICIHSVCYDIFNAKTPQLQKCMGQSDGGAYSVSGQGLVVVSS